MNKKIFLLLVAVSVAGSAFAEHYLGAHYAAGLSTIYFSPHQNETWRITPYDAGLVYRYFDRSDNHQYFNIGLQVELNLAARRYRYLQITPRWELEIDTNGVEQNNRYLDTLSKKVYSSVFEIPLIMQWQFQLTQRLNLYFNALVYVAYYMSNKEMYYDRFWKYHEDKFDFTNWNNFDLGIGGGLGLGYTVGKFEVGLEARFVMGISELFPQTIDVYESLPQQYLISVSVVRKF